MAAPSLNIEHPPHEGHIHVVPIKTYLTVFAALMVLLFLTVGVAYIDLGPLNLLVAMIVAVIKATLVVLYFMGVKYSSKLTWVWAGVGFLWLFILFATIGDYISRTWIPVLGW